jgi:PhoH-like ATPase
MDDDILVTNVSGSAGSGKSLLACAVALHKVLQEKKYKKIYVVTSNVEATEELGYRPGDVSEKFRPLIMHMEKLFIKLHNIRPANKIFININENEYSSIFNPKFIEFIPLNFLRGETLEDCVIIADELQNMNKIEVKTLMTRCGENVKFLATGDPGQVDCKYLNKENNGMN